MAAIRLFLPRAQRYMNTSLRNLVASISILRADNNVIFAEPAFTQPLAAEAELK